MGDLDLVVMDSEYERAKARVRELTSGLVRDMNIFSYAVDYILENAIVSEEIATAVRSGLSGLSGLATDISEAGETFHSSCTAFIKDIDDADEFLY